MSYKHNQRRIYVGNLPPDIRSKDIKDLFFKFGEITFIDLKDQRGPPFAFIEFENAIDAENAISERDGFDYDGYRLRVEFPRASGQGRSEFRGRGPLSRRSEFRCFVSGLPPTGSWQDLKDHMREAGDVHCANVYKDGTGVVEFLHYEDMISAVRDLNDSKFISHEGEITYIRVREDSKGGSRSRSRSFSPPRRNFSPPRRNFSPPRRNFSQPRRNFSQPRRNFSPPRRTRESSIYTPPSGLYQF